MEEEEKENEETFLVECLRRQLLELEMIQSVYFDIETLVNFEEIQRLQLYLLEYENKKNGRLAGEDGEKGETISQQSSQDTSSSIPDTITSLPSLTYCVEEPSNIPSTDSFFQRLEMKIILPPAYPSVSHEHENEKEKKQEQEEGNGEDGIFFRKSRIEDVPIQKKKRDTKPQLVFRSAERKKDKALIEKIKGKFEETHELYQGDEYILPFLQEFFALCEEAAAEISQNVKMIVSGGQEMREGEEDGEGGDEEEDYDDEENDFDYDDIAKLIELQKKKKNQGIIETDALDKKGKSDNLIEVILGRRLIHFHHIINAKKRQTLKKTALDLNLGGYCKYGWPGIVIVEGLESDVQEYVQIISSLRWQSIQVKYHKTKRLSSLLKGDRTISVDDHIDDNRVFHKDFLEVDDMKTLARICEDAGQKSLFDSFIKSGCVHKEV